MVKGGWGKANRKWNERKYSK